MVKRCGKTIFFVLEKWSKRSLKSLRRARWAMSKRCSITGKIHFPLVSAIKLMMFGLIVLSEFQRPGYFQSIIWAKLDGIFPQGLIQSNNLLPIIMLCLKIFIVFGLFSSNLLSGFSPANYFINVIFTVFQLFRFGNRFGWSFFSTVAKLWSYCWTRAYVYFARRFLAVYLLATTSGRCDRYGTFWDEKG